MLFQANSSYEHLYKNKVEQKPWYLVSTTSVVFKQRNIHSHSKHTAQDLGL